MKRYLAFLKVKSVQIPLGGTSVLHGEGIDARDYLMPSNKTLLCEVEARSQSSALAKVSKHYGIAEQCIMLCPLTYCTEFEEVKPGRRKRG